MIQHYSFVELGEYIQSIRQKFSVPVSTICADTHISSRTYYKLIHGSDLRLDAYFRTFGYLVHTYGEPCDKSEYYTNFFLIGEEEIED